MSEVFNGFQLALDDAAQSIEDDLVKEVDGFTLEAGARASTALLDLP